MNFETSLTFQFSEVTTFFWVSLDKSMKEIGLHSGQIFILFLLWKKDGQSQVDLASGLNVSPAAVNKMVKSLASSDFVKLKRSEEDNRFVRVFLTKKGTEIREKVEEQWQKLENDSFSVLTEVERLILFQIFEKLRQNLISSDDSDV